MSIGGRGFSVLPYLKKRGIVSAVCFAVIFLLLLAAPYTASSQTTNESNDFKAADFAINVLVGLIILYGAQTVTLFYLSLRKTGTFTIVIDGKSQSIEIGLSPFEWTFRNIESFVMNWVFLVVALMLPLMFTFIPDAMLVYDPPRPELTQNLTQNSMEHSASIYYLCITLLAIFITMEVSFLLNLRDIGGPWVAMLLAALGIDLISLYFFNRMGDPLGWSGNSFEKGTMWFMLAVGAFCFVSSFMTILFSRAQREMVFEGLVNPEIVKKPPSESKAASSRPAAKNNPTA